MTESIYGVYYTEIDGRWFVFEGDEQNDEVYSVGPDNPQTNRRWCARWTDAGIQYVATPCKNKAAAIRKAKKYGGCQYRGEI